MDSSNRTPTHDLPLEQVVAGALHHLEELGYSRKSLWRYRAVWQQLIGFARKEGPGEVYSPQLAERFTDAWHRRGPLPCGEGWRRHVAFCVEVLGVFHRYGDIERSRTNIERLGIPQAMKKPLQEYTQYCRERRHLRESTLRERIVTITQFMDFLASRGVQCLSDMQPADLGAYVASRQRYRPQTVARMVSNARGFLRYLVMRGVVTRTLCDVLPRIRVPRDAGIPSVWDPRLVVELLNVVDRSSPLGKRDYAILLLASRLGLRAGDLRTLRLDHLNWGEATIDVRQSKTDAHVRLPMSEEIGEALIDYLRFARPKMEHREVFLKLRSPYAPFAADNHLHNIVTHWRLAAGIRFRSQQRHGLHSLRHTLATRLLQEGTPFHIISEILGHATTASTLIYAKADTETLRGAALDTEETHHVK